MKPNALDSPGFLTSLASELEDIINALNAPNAPNAPTNVIQGQFKEYLTAISCENCLRHLVSSSFGRRIRRQVMTPAPCRRILSAWGYVLLEF